MRNKTIAAAMTIGVVAWSACSTGKDVLDFDDGVLDAALPSDGGVLLDAAPSFDAQTLGDGGARADAGASCPNFAAGVLTGRTPLVGITEASGIAASRRNPGTLWIHNDSGAGPRVYALSTMGATLAIYDLGGASARDWEDIAVGPGPVAGTSYLYVGDIGDNAESRTSIDVYRVAEPDVKSGSPTTPSTLGGVERFTLTYPDRAHNAETLLVDPQNGDVYVVAKSSDGISPVFRAAAPLKVGTTTLERVAVLRFGVAPLVGNRTTTGGDISAAGDEIAIRSYDSAFLWHRAPGVTIADALATAPCPIPLQKELQGEALGFASDGSGYYSVSEGSIQPIYFYARR